MLRRRAIPLLFALSLIASAADPARDAASVITELAANLTAGNVGMFMASFDPAMPDYERLRAGIAGLTPLGTQSYLEVVSNEGNDRERTLEVTWELRTPDKRRETKVTCKLQLQGKKWRIVAFAPIEFFVP